MAHGGESAWILLRPWFRAVLFPWRVAELAARSGNGIAFSAGVAGLGTCLGIVVATHLTTDVGPMGPFSRYLELTVGPAIRISAVLSAIGLVCISGPLWLVFHGRDSREAQILAAQVRAVLLAAMVMVIPTTILSLYTMHMHCRVATWPLMPSPLWLYAAFVVTAAVGVVRVVGLLRTLIGNSCTTCGYDLTGLGDQRCPECGTMRVAGRQKRA